MVNNATSLGRSGLQDWLYQRISAIVVAAYFAFFIVYFFFHPNIEFTQWHGLFGQIWMKIFSGLFLLSLVTHAWIGLWTVSTDYIKCTMLRVLFQSLVILLCLTYFIWGLLILWG